MPGILQFTKPPIKKIRKNQNTKKSTTNKKIWKQSLQYFINNLFEKSLDSPKQVNSLLLTEHFFLKHAKAGKEKGVSIQIKNQKTFRQGHPLQLPSSLGPSLS